MLCPKKEDSSIYIGRALDYREGCCKCVDEYQRQNIREYI